MALGRVFRCQTQTTCLCLIKSEPQAGETPYTEAYAPGRFVRIEVGGRDQGMTTANAVEKGTYLVGFVYNALLLTPLAARGVATDKATGEIQTGPSALRSAIIAIWGVGGIEQNSTPSAGTGRSSVTQ